MTRKLVHRHVLADDIAILCQSHYFDQSQLGGGVNRVRALDG